MEKVLYKVVSRKGSEIPITKENRGKFLADPKGFIEKWENSKDSREQEMSKCNLK